MQLWIAALATALTACAATGVAVLSGPVDAPKDRGMHRRATPTGGGIAILLGLSLGVVLYAPGMAGLHNRDLAATLALALAMGLVGAADDLFDLGARAKLIIQTLMAIIYCAVVTRVEALSTPLGPVVLGPVLGGLGSALWIVVVTNGVNFMDGANGLSPGAMIIALAVLAVGAALGGASGVAVLALLGAAAGLGFLPWNLPGGRIFQGDAGALFSSALFAGLLLVASGHSGEWTISLWFGPLALLPLLTDVFLTLLQRARRGESLLKAHRDHLFQRWLLASGQSHGALALRIWAMMLVMGGAAIGLCFTPIAARSLVFAVALAASVWVWRAIDRKIRPSG